MKKVLFFISSFLLLSGCACPRAVQVDSIQRDDKKLTCKNVVMEINEAEYYRKQARKNQYTKVEYVLNPLCYPSGFISGNKGMRAADERLDYLNNIYDLLGCGSEKQQQQQRPPMHSQPRGAYPPGRVPAPGQGSYLYPAPPPGYAPQYGGRMVPSAYSPYNNPYGSYYPAPPQRVAAPGAGVHALQNPYGLPPNNVAKKAVKITPPTVVSNISHEISEPKPVVLKAPIDLLPKRKPHRRKKIAHTKKLKSKPTTTAKKSISTNRVAVKLATPLPFKVVPYTSSNKQSIPNPANRPQICIEYQGCLNTDQ